MANFKQAENAPEGGGNPNDPQVLYAEDWNAAIKMLSATMGLAVHLGDVDYLRPDNFLSVLWIGWVEPLEATEHDLLILINEP